MHFFESSIITTTDGIHCQVYGNEHPTNSILVKPKYIPTHKISCNELQYRFISGKRMNRLNLWIDSQKLSNYLSDFKQVYYDYIFQSLQHNVSPLFFSVPIDKIERVYFPRVGFRELMSMPEGSLDKYLKSVKEFSLLLLKSGLKMKDLGITYSTLMGHYNPEISDINIVIYGKDNFWKLMSYLQEVNHPSLKWKTDQEWLDFRERRSRAKLFTPNEFLYSMRRKKSEGFFNNHLFVIFAAEKEEEVWFKWGTEKYTCLGKTTINAKIASDFSSVVRPGCYEVKEGICKDFPNLNGLIKQVVFYSRDYCMLAQPGEMIQAHGTLEKVDSTNGSFYRLVLGYFDSYLDESKETEYIKVIDGPVEI